MIDLTEADLGKKFKTRGGEIVTLSDYNFGIAYPFSCNNGSIYTEGGCYWDKEDETSPYDLIERIDEQQPVNIVINGQASKEDTVTIEPQKSGFLVNGHAFTELNEVFNWIDDFYQSEQEQDDWIDWHGGECPVDGDIEVEVIMLDGEPDKGRASAFFWGHYQGVVDIIKYRVVPN